MHAASRIELIARRALLDPGAEAALRWYPRVGGWAWDLATSNSLRLETVVGVVAALSPINGWESQLEWTPRILSAWANLPRADGVLQVDDIVGTASDWLPGPGTSANKRKAARILCGEEPLSVLSGPKVRAFYGSILGDTSSVCVDRHAWAIADGTSEGRLTAKRYRDTVSAFIRVSARLQSEGGPLANLLTPSGVQSLTWTYWRENPEDRI